MKVKLPYKLSNKEQAAMNAEIQKQLDEARVRDADEFDASMLWALHLCFGFGKKNLRKFYDFYRTLYNVSGRWQFGRKEIDLLKKIGVDIVGWNRDNAEDNGAD